MKRKRYHIRAWGSDIYPDLDYESDYADHWVRRYYPFTDIALQHVIPLKALVT